ncbi:MAG: anthranilate synthase component I family protein [Ghiorsea sp.]
MKSIEQKEYFFSKWQNDLTFSLRDFPTVHHIFYMAYESGILFEDMPAPKDKFNGPFIWRHEPKWSICFDNDQQRIFMSSTQSEAELDNLELLLKSSISHPTIPVQHKAIEKSIFDYQQAVNQVKDYIRAGDIFQANIAQFWSMPFSKDDILALYTSLRDVNPAPFSCVVDVDDMVIVSASPERLFSISADQKVSTRPIAGTRKRSDGERDEVLKMELLLSEKERAEHIMLVDLMRNDLGRVCESGSIHVDECMVVEQYATVQHIVSNVCGQLDSKNNILDVIAALFPGGTITGCPKVRCMEIIHELEPQPRGPYTGGVGYVAWDGSVDMNILIRTFWLNDVKLSWAAGAGIVADSVPEHEAMETEHKVEGLLRAIR